MGTHVRIHMREGEGVEFSHRACAGYQTVAFKAGQTEVTYFVNDGQQYEKFVEAWEGVLRLLVPEPGVLQRLASQQAGFERLLEDLQVSMEGEGDVLPEHLREIRERVEDAVQRLAEPLEIFREVVHQLEELEETPMTQEEAACYGDAESRS